MIRSLAVVANGLHGACLLALGRAEGLRSMEWDLRGAARSFWAAALCLPGLLCLRVMDWGASGAPNHPVDSLLLDLLAYAIGWAGYAVLSQAIAGAIGRERLWPRFIVAWNWCNVVQYVLLVLGILPSALGAPWTVGETANLVAMGWALWLEWFAVRLALDVAAVPAAAFVLMDLTLGLVLAAVIR